MDDARSHSLAARLRQRMLLAIGRGVQPMASTAAYGELPERAERFAAGDDFAHPEDAAFLAALNDDPDLAESFLILAEATWMTGPVAPSSGLAARLAAIPRAEASSVSAPWPVIALGRPIAVARAVAAWAASDLAALLSALGTPPETASSGGAARTIGEPGAPRYDPGGQEQPAPGTGAPLFRLSDSSGTRPSVDLALNVAEQPGGDTVSVTLALREPGTVNPSPHAWEVIARIARRPVPGAFTAPGTWEPERALQADEFAQLTIAVQRAPDRSGARYA